MRTCVQVQTPEVVLQLLVEVDQIVRQCKTQAEGCSHFIACVAQDREAQRVRRAAQVLLTGHGVRDRCDARVGREAARCAERARRGRQPPAAQSRPADRGRPGPEESLR